MCVSETVWKGRLIRRCERLERPSFVFNALVRQVPALSTPPLSLLFFFSPRSSLPDTFFALTLERDSFIPTIACLLCFISLRNSWDEVEQEDLATFCQASSTLKRAYDLVQEFMRMVRKREGYRLDAWLERIAASDLAELQPFAAGVEKDKAAVKAGLTWPVNNAQVEGQVTKLKLIKRTMYGKAGFPLLRQRVLHAV